MITALIILVALVFLAAASYQDFAFGEVDDRLTLWFLRVVLFIAFLCSIFKGDLNIFFSASWYGFCFFMVSLAFFRLGMCGGADIVVSAGLGSSLALLSILGYEIGWTWMPFYLSYLTCLFIAGLLALVALGTNKFMSNRLKFIPILALAFFMVILI